MAFRQNNTPERSKLSRRRFLGAAGAVAGAVVVPCHVLGAKRDKAKQPPSAKLNIACVGLGAIGAENLGACGTENIVALCDVDSRMASETFKRYPDAARYKDFRRMLDKGRDIDAVIVATPDNTHAVITVAAMRQGKNVYTQMPLAHDVWEVRELARIARETKVTTQMGNTRHSGPGVRRVCEWVWGGVLGDVREVHCWTHQPRWPQGMSRPKAGTSVPPQFDWDLWLGPAPKRPYNPAYHPYFWRGWQDFGTGALGAVGCHLLSTPFWAMKLAEADRFTITAESTGIGDASWPKASTIRYDFPARGDMPPVAVTWYDGGRKPPMPAEMPDSREHVGSNGALFYGDKGKMIFGAPVNAGPLRFVVGPQLIPESPMRSLKLPRESLPRVKNWQSDARHEQEWIRACKQGGQPCSSFEVAGPLTEMVLLGNVALLAGRPIEWDRKAMKITGEPDVNKHLRREYRKGWSL